MEDNRNIVTGTSQQKQNCTQNNKKQQKKQDNNQKMDMYLIKLKPPVLAPVTTKVEIRTNPVQLGSAKAGTKLGNKSKSKS